MMQAGDILSARRTREGIMLHTVGTVEDGEVTQFLIREVLPDDPDWLVAVGALPPETELPPELQAEPIEVVRHRSLAGANRVVGQTRQYFITDLPGQDMIYLRKEQEARDFLAQTDPIDLALLPVWFPLLAAEIGVTAPDPGQLAQIWLNMSAMWIPVAAALEHVRLRCTTDVQAATTTEEIYAAMTVFYAELAALLEPMGQTNV